jgi:hypothetical protein
VAVGRLKDELKKRSSKLFGKKRDLAERQNVYKKHILM